MPICFFSALKRTPLPIRWLHPAHHTLNGISKRMTRMPWSSFFARSRKGCWPCCCKAAREAVSEPASRGKASSEARSLVARACPVFYRYISESNRGSLLSVLRQQRLQINRGGQGRGEHPLYSGTTQAAAQRSVSVELFQLAQHRTQATSS